MKHVLLILTTLLLTNCGQQPGGNENNSKQDQDDSNDDGLDHPQAEKEIITEYKKTPGGDLSIAVANTSELPECQHQNDKQLAYVKTEDQFYSCSDETWEPIDIRGEQGEPGQKGEKGDQGTTAPQVPPNQWYDPITKLSWLIGSPTQEAQVNANVVCGNDWTLPSKQQAQAAVQHGLILASQALSSTGPTKLWTSEFSVTACPIGQDQCRAAIDQSGVERYGQLATNAGVICLRQ